MVVELSEITRNYLFYIIYVTMIFFRKMLNVLARKMLKVPIVTLAKMDSSICNRVILEDVPNVFVQELQLIVIVMTN